MKTNRTTLTIFTCLLAASLFVSGCTSWEQRYKALNVEHENLKGLYENCRQTLDVSGSEKSTLADQLSQKQRTIDDMQRQLDEQRKSPAFVSGFGDKYQVDVDAAAGTIMVTLPNKILFSPGKANLKKASSGDLNHIASVLEQRYAGRDIDVLGHTDSDPIKKSKWKDNWQLSSERALSVVRYLRSRGIAPKRLRAVGCGQNRPVTSNATRSGKAKNRRVEIVVNMR